jgi:hypothetical protein
MNFYDATIEGFEPDELEPRAGGWYPLPGKPGEVYQRVDIPNLEGMTNDIQFLINIAEKETASTDVEKGMISSAKATLGEIQIAVGKANERINAMAPFYNLSWQRFVEKWLKITQANMGKMKEELFKKSPTGQYVGKEITAKDLTSEKGFKVIVENKAQKEQNQIAGLNSLIAIKNEFPNNKKLRLAIQKRALKIVELNPEEMDEILEEEEMMATQAQEMGAEMGGAPEQAPSANPMEAIASAMGGAPMMGQ